MLPQTRTPEMPANSRSTFALVASEGSGPADPGSPTSRPQRWETVPLSRGAPRTGVRPCVPAAPRASAASSAGVTGVSQGNQRRKCWRHGLCLLSSFSASSTLWFSVFSVGSRSALSPWVCGSRLRPRAAPPGGHVGRALWIPRVPRARRGWAPAREPARNGPSRAGARGPWSDSSRPGCGPARAPGVGVSVPEGGLLWPPDWTAASAISTVASNKLEALAPLVSEYLINPAQSALFPPPSLRRPSRGLSRPVPAPHHLLFASRPGRSF